MCSGRWGLAVVMLLSVLGEAQGQSHQELIQRCIELDRQASEHYQRGEYRQMEELGKEMLRLARGFLADSPIAEANACNTLGTAYCVQGRYADAKPLYERALEVRRRLFGENELVADSLHNLANLYALQRRYGKAEPLYKQALQIERRVLGNHHPDVATSLTSLARLYSDQGRYAEAEPLYEESLEIRRAALGPSHPDVARSLDDLATTYAQQARFDKVEPLYQQALEIFRKARGNSHPDVAGVLNNLANFYFKLGRYDKAKPLYRQALEIYREAYGNEDPHMAMTLDNLARACAADGCYGDAEELCKRALQIYRAVTPGAYPELAACIANLAGMYRDQGRYAEAEPLYEEALQIRRDTLHPTHPDLAASLHNLAVLYADQGRYREAEPLYKQALELRRNVASKDLANMAANLNDLANLYSAQGRYAEAEVLYKEALERCRQLEVRENLPGTILNGLGQLYAAQGRYAEAEAAYEQAMRSFRESVGEKSTDMARCLANLGVLYFEQGRCERGKTLLEQALEIDRASRRPDCYELAAELHNLASFYQREGRYLEAEQLYKQAMETCRKSLGTQHPLVAASLNNLAALYSKLGRYAEAESLCQEALEILEESGSDPQIKLRTHWVRAELAWRTGRRKQAVADLEEALRTIEQQRAQVSGAELERAGFFGRWTGLFELMVTWQTELDNPAAVLNALERSRARTLLDQMAMAGVDLLAGLPEEQAQQLRQEEAEAAGRVATARKQLDFLASRRDMSEPHKQREEQRLLKELRRAQREYAQVYAELRNASPLYRLAISDDREPVPMEQLSRWLAERQGLLLEYFVGDEGGYLFVLDGSGRGRVYKLRLTSEQAQELDVEQGPLNEKRLEKVLVREDETGVLDHLRASREQKRLAQAIAGLSVLWEVLLPPAEREGILSGRYEHLVIVPAGTLAFLPFEALVVEEGEEPKYLLDVGPPILYGPSATVLVNLSGRAGQVLKSKLEPVLAVGDCVDGLSTPAATRDSLTELTPAMRYRSFTGKLSRLAYSSWELAWIAEVFGRAGIKVRQLRGERATEANVREEVGGRRFVDFACHGLVDQRYGNLFGALALSPGSGNAADDGYLTLAETYGLPLSGCELAILSACQTNVGPEQRGEGVWSLSRGFLAAGSRRVVASQWLLDDEAAASMVSYFCSIVAKTEATDEKADYAKALHRAKRWLRSVKSNKCDWTSPYYWAPMVLIGPQ